ncbi:hypothetical protein AEYBE204_17495 [Asticcacaulis sp. YBE204]|nr:hypothetical protein AEYBE204_17495 [Asticcacaulis sp. YBE204]
MIIILSIPTFRQGFFCLIQIMIALGYLVFIEAWVHYIIKIIRNIIPVVELLWSRMALCQPRSRIVAFVSPASANRVETFGIEVKIVFAVNS